MVIFGLVFLLYFLKLYVENGFCKPVCWNCSGFILFKRCANMDVLDCSISKVKMKPESNLGPCRTSTIEPFGKIVDG